MEKRVLGVVLLLCAAALVWPSASPLPNDGSWGPAGTLGYGSVGGGVSGLDLLKRMWSRSSPASIQRRGAPESQTARLRPLDPLRDSPNDPASSFWDRAFSQPLVSARPGRPRPTPTPPSFASSHRPPSPTPTQPRSPSPKPPPVPVTHPATLTGNLLPPHTPPSVPVTPQKTPNYPRYQGAEGAAASQRGGGKADFDGRRGGSGSGRITKPSTTDVPSWEPAKKNKKEEQEKAAKPVKPPTLGDWLGRGALKAPRQRIDAPTFTPLRALFPERLPDGRTYERASPPAAAAEALVPPDERPLYEDWLYADERRKRGSAPHWHQDGSDWLFHAGKAWGAPKDGRWSWLLESDRRWWTVADGAQRLVRHEGAWWWRTEDGWFLLKGGEPWAWRRFPEWEGHGFIHPTRGTQVVYSADGARVAVMTPGAETVVFDCATGEVLGRYPAGARPSDAAAPLD